MILVVCLSWVAYKLLIKVKEFYVIWSVISNCLFSGKLLSARSDSEK